MELCLEYIMPGRKTLENADFADACSLGLFKTLRGRSDSVVSPMTFVPDFAAEEFKRASPTADNGVRAMQLFPF